MYTDELFCFESFIKKNQYFEGDAVVDDVEAGLDALHDREGQVQLLREAAAVQQVSDTSHILLCFEAQTN